MEHDGFQTLPLFLLKRQKIVFFLLVEFYISILFKSVCIYGEAVMAKALLRVLEGIPKMSGRFLGLKELKLRYDVTSAQQRRAGDIKYFHEECLLKKRYYITKRNLFVR